MIPKKLNPKVLRDLISEIVEDVFGTYSRAATVLVNHFNDERANPSIDRGTWSRIVKDKQHIRYQHLEALGNYLQVPAGALLLLSRFRALHRDNKTEELDQFLNATIEFCEYAQETQDLSAGALIAIYQKHQKK